MLRNSRFKKILITTLVLILVLGTAAVAAESIYNRQITATYGRIKFKVDGKDVTNQIESKYGTPAFVVEDRSYVPVRAIAELMGLEIKYDNNTHTAEIIDLKANEYEKELKSKDAEISKLKKEIETLKKNVVEETSLKKIEDKLNKDFGTHKNVDFDISLKENKNDISVSITVDLRTSAQKNDWNRMNNNDKKYMIEDIVSDITKEFSNIKIAGSIYDNNSKRDLLTFTKNKNSSNISISHKSSTGGSGYYSDDYIDRAVEDEFYKNNIDDAYVTYISESGTTVQVDINFSSYYSREWDRLSITQIETMLDNIADEINYDYRDKDVDIEIYMDRSYEGRYTRDYNKSRGTFSNR